MYFKVYSNRWGHVDTYKIKFIDTGWRIDHKAINGDCDPSGNPYLYSNFNQDYVSYPADLKYYMETLWEAVKNGDLEEHEIQDNLDQLSEWVQVTEKNAPRHGIWK